MESKNFCVRHNTKWICSANSFMSQRNCPYYQQGLKWCKHNERKNGNPDSNCRSLAAREEYDA